MSSDEDLLNSLLERWETMRQRLVGHLCTRGWSEDDAQDLFGEAILRAAERHHKLADHDAAESWFWQLTNRLAIDKARTQKRRPRTRANIELDTLPADEPDDEDVCSCSMELLEELPDSYLDILKTIDVDGLAVKDYAHHQDITPNLASVRLHRARRALRDKLYDTCQTTSVAECMECSC